MTLAQPSTRNYPVRDKNMPDSSKAPDIIPNGINYSAALCASGEEGLDFGAGGRGRRTAGKAAALYRRNRREGDAVARTLQLRIRRRQGRDLERTPQKCVLRCDQGKRAVPDDIAVVGVDNNESICENTTPSLTSVRPDFAQGGRLAANLLMRKINGSSRIKPETVFSVAGIVRRGSTRLLCNKDASVSAALERIWSPTGSLLTAKDVLSEFPCSRRDRTKSARLAQNAEQIAKAARMTCAIN